MARISELDTVMAPGSMDIGGGMDIA